MPDTPDLPGHITEGRWRLLLNVARGADPPDDLSDKEREIIEDMKRTIAKHPDAAIEIPIE